MTRTLETFKSQSKRTKFATLERHNNKTFFSMKYFRMNSMCLNLRITNSKIEFLRKLSFI